MSEIKDVNVGERKALKDDFEIIWENIRFSVSYSLPARIFKRMQGARDVPKTKTILHGIGGHLRSGELIALMGPSGAGKTTLMESIVGLRDYGKTGDVNVYGEDLKSVKVSFIAQKNFFLKYLTVRETIYYATRIHTATKLSEGTLEKLCDESGKPLKLNEYCSKATDKMIANLGLTVCEHNRVPHCSGGQQKRVAIAQELVAKPRIMILDEPTSGLDSASCYSVVEMLRDMTQESPKIAILLTIHQPSYKILNLFHKVYFVSARAECIYEDTPADLLSTLSNCGLNVHGFNPAEVMLEVACGDYGDEVIHLLSENQKKMHSKHVAAQQEKRLTARKLDDLLHRDHYPTMSHIMTLVQRNYFISIRDPIAFVYRITSVVGVGIFLTTVFGTDIGIRGGCPPHFDASFEPSQLKQIGDEIEDEVKAVYNNVGNMFFITLFMMFSALMPSCLTFPDEMRVFKMERENSWYSSSTFYWAKFIAETPFEIAVLTAFLPMTYVIQNQIPSVWRFSCVYILLLLVEYIATTLGFITGAMFMYNVPASVYLGPTMCIIPFMLLSGAFAKAKDFSEPFKWISMLSYLKFAIESVSVALYGYNRCGSDVQKRLMDGKNAFIVWMSAMLGLYNDDGDSEATVANSTESAAGVASEKFVEELIDSMAGDFISDEEVVRSAVLNIYGYEDWFLIRGIIVLVFYLIAVRMIAYSIIKLRVKSA